MRSSLDDFEARKAQEIYQSLQQRRRQQRDEWESRERRRAEMRATAKVATMPCPWCRQTSQHSLRLPTEHSPFGALCSVGR